MGHHEKQKYLLAGVIFCLFIALIFMREYNGNYYRVSAEEAYQISLNRNIFMTPASLDTLNEGSLMISLSEKSDNDALPEHHLKIMHIVPTELLIWKNRRQFNNLTGSIVLQSKNLRSATNAWVILSRRGYRNIRILDENSNEELKYAFQRDTLRD